MNVDLILFLVLAVVAVAAALAMLFSRNAVYSALFLILNFATVAVFYLLLGAPFIALTQITVYAGAIMVLFLFVIMLLGVEHLKADRKLAWQMPIALLLAVVLLGEVGYLVFVRGDLLGAIERAASSSGSPLQIGQVLFTEYLLPFEVTSILLLVAMVGVIVLTRGGKPVDGGETGDA